MAEYTVNRVGNLLSISCPAVATRDWANHEIASVLACSGDVCTRASAIAVLNGADAQPAAPRYKGILKELGKRRIKGSPPEYVDSFVRRTMAAEMIQVLAAAELDMQQIAGRA